jgi:hypothetical protein
MCGLYRIELIDECFSHDTVEEIIDALVSIIGFCLFLFSFNVIYS